MSKMKVTQEFVEKFNTSNKDILHLMPANRREYRLMVVLSFIAGSLEEILYRGFLFWWLTSHLSIYMAIPLASLPFALAHLSTTGFKNSFMAFILGLLWTGSFLLTDSLWLAIVTHILIDLYSSTQGIKVAESNYNQQESSG
jgi:membrane protease YdiL (CAAX protease family)